MPQTQLAEDPTTEVPEVLTTITFSEQPRFTTNPTFEFDNNTVTTVGQIVSDGAQPQSPVIAANTSYRGPVFLYFENPVNYVSLDVGYFDNVGSTRIEFRDAAGNVIHVAHNSGLGVLTFEFASDLGIASVAAIDESFDDAGFSVDTVVFGDPIADLDPPTIELLDTVPAGVDRDLGVIEADTEYFFSDSVSEVDTQDYIRLTANEQLTATIRVYLNSNPNDVRELAVTFEQGVNIIQLSALPGYTDAEPYSVIVDVNPPTRLPEDDLIDDLFASVAGALVFDFNAKKYEIFQLVIDNMDNADDAARILGKIGKAFGVLGLVLDIGNRIDNVYNSNDAPRQAFIEIVDMFTGMAATGAVTAGVSFVGTPIAGVLGGFVTGLIYTFGLSNSVRNAANGWYDDLLNEANLENSGALPGDLIGVDEVAGDVDISANIFDADFYLDTYADAAEAVNSGAAVSALAYYLSIGINQGHQINDQGTVVAPADLALNVTIDNPANLFDIGVFAAELGTRPGDGVTTPEANLADYINEQRTDGTEYAFNAALSALANRIAVDWIGNRAEAPFGVASAAAAATWAEMLTNGQSYQDALDSIADAAGIDLSQTQILAAWNPGATAAEVFAYLSNSTAGSQALIGLDYNAMGIANFGGMWVILLSDGFLADDVTTPDDSGVLYLFGEETSDFIVGSESADDISAFAGNDEVSAAGGNDIINGGNGNDTLRGGAGNDVIEGGNQEDLLFGDTGNDTMDGGAGFDLMYGGSGNDFMNGGNQADNLFGQQGEDTLLGGNGFDRLFGGDDDDVAYGWFGTDALFGQLGNDRLYGQGDNDRLFGGQGNDLVDGGSGDDEITGGAGFDTIVGGTGNDLLVGAFNADTFVFADFGGGFGQDTIRDFDANNVFERIDLRLVSSIRDLNDLLTNHATQVGQDVLIDAGGGNTILLEGVDRNDLDASDFIF
ncbi:calcium-binding protein [Sulfitobacter sp. G21635-S1]|uniref:calcium-binding protein n=1 Tax=Sulfitobacter sp. G21635-S1 TaxID=3014043 RepID=UPI0022AFD784|nr:calcium-binding protein [Sulfitobacter sp. G21635-S1]MCZ4258119.1 calcium-binding protein [Sulfitobacter sp. G21635-S1]